MQSTLTNLVARRDLLRALIVGDLRSHTAESKLGPVWWLLDPLLMIGIYWVFVVIIFGRDRYEPYPIFLGPAIMAWKHLSVSLNKSAGTLYAHNALIKSVPFPTLALPLALVLSQFVHFAAALALIVLAAILMGLPLGLELLQLPLLCVLQISLVAGLAMVVSCYGAMFRDLQNLLQHVLRIGWYVSPAIYGMDLVAQRLGDVTLVGSVRALDVYRLNPFALLFEGYRACVFDPAWIAPGDWALLATQAAGVLALGIAVFRYYDRRVIKFI